MLRKYQLLLDNSDNGCGLITRAACPRRHPPLAGPVAGNFV
jgi:hypothetical protein